MPTIREAVGEIDDRLNCVLRTPVNDGDKRFVLAAVKDAMLAAVELTIYLACESTELLPVRDKMRAEIERQFPQIEKGE